MTANNVINALKSYLKLNQENAFPSLVVQDGLAGNETFFVDCVGQSGAWSTNLCISQPKPLCTFAGHPSMQADLRGAFAKVSQPGRLCPLTGLTDTPHTAV